MNERSSGTDPDAGSSASSSPSHLRGVQPVSSASGRGISWVTERDALRTLGDRKARAMLAVFTARRSARNEVFFVPPQIADLYGLKPRDLCWALNALEGALLTTIGAAKGKFRMIRLLPKWEDRVRAEISSIRPRRGSRATATTPEAAPWPGDHAELDDEVAATLAELAKQRANSSGAGPVG